MIPIKKITIPRDAQLPCMDDSVEGLGQWIPVLSTIDSAVVFLRREFAKLSEQEKIAVCLLYPNAFTWGIEKTDFKRRLSAHMFANGEEFFPWSVIRDESECRNGSTDVLLP